MRPQACCRPLMSLAMALAVSACSGGGDSARLPGSLPGAGSGNRAPVAVNDTVQSTGAALTVPVLGNDLDPDGDRLAIIEVTPPDHGTATLNDAGTPGDTSDDFIVYTPAAGYTGADNFSYTISDGGNGRATGEVTVLGLPTLEAQDKTVTTLMSTSVVITVLDGDAIQIDSVSVPAFGTVAIDSAGTPSDPSDDYLVYSPADGYTGTDAFFYTVSGPDGRDQAAVSVTVTAAPSAPPQPTVTGQVVKGLVRDAAIRLFEIGPDGGRLGVPVAAATTNSQGQWGAALPAVRPPLLVVAAGGRYDDETQSPVHSTIELGSAEIIAVLPADENFVVSSLYTNALYLRARHATGATGFAGAYAAARAMSLNEWGMDIAATPTADPALPDPALPDAQRTHAMALGGAATALASIITDLGLSEPNAATIDAIVRDLADCDLDGRDFDGVIEIAGAPIADDTDLNLSIVRFRNNNSDRYLGTPVANWNAAECIVTDPPPEFAPVVTIDQRRTRNASTALSGTIDDPTATVLVTVDGMTWPAANLGGHWQLEAGTIAPPLADGVYDVIVEATDTAGLIGRDASTSELVIDATAPDIAIDTTVSTSGSPAITGTVDDPAAIIVVTIAGNDHAAAVSGADWTVPAGVISMLAEGSYAVAVTATDSFGNVGALTRSAALIVSQNDPPAFTITNDIVVDEDFAGARFVDVVPGPVPDDEADQLVSYTLNPPTVGFADVSISPGSGRVTVTAVADAVGTQAFTILADDGQPYGNYASQAFTLTVDPINDAPVFAVSGNITATENFSGSRLVTVLPAPVPTDEAGQVVTYSLSPASVAFANVALEAATGTVTITSVPGGSGAQLFTLTADDGQAVNATASATFTLTVDPSIFVNTPPTTAGIADVIANENAAPALVDLFAAFADAEDADAALVYTIVGNTYPALFDSTVVDGVAGTLTLDFAPDASGMATLTVRATDTGGASVETAFDVTVNDTPTSAGIADLAVNENAAPSVLDLFAAFDDLEDADAAMTYALVGNTNGTLFDSTVVDGVAGTLTLVFAADAPGVATLTVSATDTGGASVEATFDVIVNDTPTTSGIADITVSEDAAPSVIDLFAAFDDSEDTDTDLVYTVVANSNPALFDTVSVDGVAGTLTLNFSADTTGVSTLTVRAADTGGAFVEASLNVSVNALADLGIASLGPDKPSPGIGKKVVFTLVLQNDGPSTATDVTVSIPLPAGYTYLTANNPAEYNSTTGEWTRASVSGTATLVLTAVVNPAGPYDVTAEVVAVNEPDPDSTPGNGDDAEDDQRTTTTTPRPVTDLSLSMTASDPIPSPGGALTLTVQLSNLGPIDATGITITLPPLPGQLTWEGAAPSAGAFDLLTGVWDGFDIAWSGDPLAPLSSTLTVAARVDLGVPIATTLEPTATVTGLDQIEDDSVEQDSTALLVLAAGLDHEWVGGAGPDPTDWHNPANWDTGLVPSPGDNVKIPPTGNDPVLSADALSLAKLDIEAGAQMSLDGFTLSTVGSLDARDGPVVGPGLVRLEFGKLRGTVPDLEVVTASPTVKTEFNGDVTINGDFTISQGVIDTKFRTVNVNGNLLSTGTGILMQKEGGSEVIVSGDARFEGGDYTQLIGGKFPLKDGELRIGGNFEQVGHPHSFAAEHKHLVILEGSGPQSVFFQNPDSSNPATDEPALTGSRFAKLRIDKDADTDGAVTLLSDVVVLRELLETLAGVPRMVAVPGSGHVLIIGGADLDTPPFPQTENIVFDNVPLHIFQGDALEHLEGLVFTNMDSTVAQLTFVRSAFDGPNDLIGSTFETAPDFAAGGRYIVFDNIHPDPTKNLTLEVLQSLPMHGLPMTEVIGNATILWGTGAEDTDRDGILDADEYTSGTNPVFADSDGDGAEDPDELLLGTDPVVTDSDGDGIADGAELAAGGDPLTPSAPGAVLYVRPAPLGDDANSGFGGWGDALATNAAVEAALIDGAGAGQPFYVLYDAGVYLPVEIDTHDNVSLVGSLGPGITVPVSPPTTIFDASTIPDVAVVRIVDSTGIGISGMLLTGARNDAGGPDGSVGGGVYINDSSTALLSDLVIEDNMAADAGGGIYVEQGGIADVRRALIRRNVVPNGGVGGGGIAVLGGLTLSDSVIADNRYDGNNTGGGGLYLESISAPVTVHDNLILGNFSAASGGGLMFWDVQDALTIFNNVIAGNANDADLGGGMAGDRLDRGAVTLIESNTIAFNRSLSDNDSAGGIHLTRADDAQLRDNVSWYNVDADTVDELQDQFVDDGDRALFEYNSFEDFGAGDVSFNNGANPRFENGFYLRPDSGVDDTGSRTAAAAGLGLPYTTSINGSEDLGTLDRGFHYRATADGTPYAATLVGETAECATDTLTMQFVVKGVGGDLGPGHVIGVRVDGDDTAGGTLVTRTGIKVYGWANSQLAIDEGDGVYRFSVDGVAHASGEVAVYELEIDDAVVMVISSSDLTSLFATQGC